MADDEVTRAKDMAGRKRNTDMLPWRIVLVIKILWYDGDFAETDVMQHHGVVSVQVRVFVSSVLDTVRRITAGLGSCQ